MGVLGQNAQHVREVAGVIARLKTIDEPARLTCFSAHPMMEI